MIDDGRANILPERSFLGDLHVIAE